MVNYLYYFPHSSGKTAHAAAAPWEGINALDAAVACYNNVSMMRQQMKPNNRIHGIIVDGGQKPNIIPERSELSFNIRASKDVEVTELVERLRKCAEGAVSATGEVLIITFYSLRRELVLPNGI